MCVCVFLIHCDTKYAKLTQIILQSNDLAEDIGGITNFRDSSCKSFSTMTKCVVTTPNYCTSNTVTLKMCGDHTRPMHFKQSDT